MKKKTDKNNLPEEVKETDKNNLPEEVERA